MNTSPLIVLCCLLSLLLPSCERGEAKGDVTFAKSVFESLVRGDSSAIEKIDWETFTSLGLPIGQQYVAFANEAERTKFSNGFVTQFASGFRDSGGSAENFTNWRVISHDETHTEVAADSNGGTLTLMVSERDGKERLSAIQFVK